MSIVMWMALVGCAYQEELRDVQAAPSTEVAAPSDTGGGRGEAKRRSRAPSRPAASAAPEAEEASMAKDSAELDMVVAPGKGGKGGSTAEPAAVREWFPETFLWRPQVRTDDDGLAVVDVQVPDQLTTWRVLALAHDQAGHQAGATHTFESRLPVSVDPVVPGWLYAGDEVLLSAQAASLGESFRGSVRMRGGGALEGSAGGAIVLDPGDSTLTTGLFRATRSGRGELAAALESGEVVDAAKRSVTVRPQGKKSTRSRSGVLSESRAFTLAAPGSLEERLSVRVFPGPLALFQSELDRVADAPPGALTYGLLDGLTELARAGQIDLDADRTRTVRLRAWQRLVRDARSPDAGAASRLLVGLGTPDDELAAALAERLQNVVVQGQRGDGTWSSRSKTTVQHVLVETAVAARALPESAKGPRIRASGAFERLLPMVDDPFTAAWILASGVLDTGSRAELEQVVIDGMVVREGVHSVGDIAAVGARGWAPTRAEVLAVTWLALENRTDLDWRGDLLSELLQTWSADSGFGAGWADALALEAIRKGMPAIDQPVRISMTVDGAGSSSGLLDPAQPNQPVLLEAPSGGAIRVSADPPVPGLAFVAELDSWAPFTGSEELSGVEVKVTQGELRAGIVGTVTVTIAAPSGTSVEVVQGLPAGTVVEVASASKSQLAESAVLQDRVTLRTSPFTAGEIKTLVLEVQPKFAGRMGTRPMLVRAAGRSAQLEPMRWTVAP